MLDLTKPIRFKKSKQLVHYIGKNSFGIHIIEVEGQDCATTNSYRHFNDSDTEQMLENVPERRETFICIYNNSEIPAYQWPTIEQTSFNDYKDEYKGIVKVTWEGDQPISVELIKE